MKGGFPSKVIEKYYCYHYYHLLCTDWSCTAVPLSWKPCIRGSVCQMAQQAGRPVARGAQGRRRRGKGDGCHFKVCASLSWSAQLCNSHIIIRGRPGPGACQLLRVWSCLVFAFPRLSEMKIWCIAQRNVL